MEQLANHLIELMLYNPRTTNCIPYRGRPKTLDFQRMEIEKMLAMKFIEPSQTKWAALIMFALKKNASLWFRVNYPKLSRVTIQNTYRIPRMDEGIDSLGNATIFSRLEENSSYQQMKDAEKDRDKTAFPLHKGIFRFVRLPLKLRHVSWKFQAGMNFIMSPLKSQVALLYLEYSILFQSRHEERITHVRTVLNRLKQEESL